MEITGRIRMIGAEQQVTASLRKRELVVTTEEQYPQHILIEFIQDKCDLLNSYKVNDGVKVSINIRGREWVNPQGETRFFNSISGWRIDRLATDTATTQPASAPAVPAMPTTEAFAPATHINQDEPDDLPF